MLIRLMFGNFARMSGCTRDIFDGHLNVIVLMSSSVTSGCPVRSMSNFVFCVKVTFLNSHAVHWQLSVHLTLHSFHLRLHSAEHRSEKYQNDSGTNSKLKKKNNFNKKILTISSTSFRLKVSQHFLRVWKKFKQFYNGKIVIENSPDKIMRDKIK